MVTKKAALWGAVALLFLAGGLAFVCLAWAAVHTASTMSLKTRTVPVDMNDLLLDGSAFPEGWYLWVGPQPIPGGEQGEMESVYAEFHHQEVSRDVVAAGQRVFRYANERSATVAFQPLLHHEFHAAYMATPWETPQEWTYSGGVADEFEFACGEISMRRRYWRCQALARYDEYISFFFAELHPDYMTLEHVERILVAIDERMAFYLQENTE